MSTELSELLDKKIPNRVPSLIKTARTLTDRVSLLLVGRGKLGAILVMRQGTWHGQCLDQGQVISIVGCEDYLLAGFLSGLNRHARPQTALATVKVATAQMGRWTDQKTPTTAQKQIRVHVTPL